MVHGRHGRVLGFAQGRHGAARAEGTLQTRRRCFGELPMSCVGEHARCRYALGEQQQQEMEMRCRSWCRHPVSEPLTDNSPQLPVSGLIPQTLDLTSQNAILGANSTLRGLGSVSHPRNRSELPQPFLFVAVLTTMTSSRRCVQLLLFLL